MGKAGRWLKSILAGRKDKALHPPYHHQQQGGDATPLPASPREKKRWSFRRPAPAQQGKASSSNAAAAPSPLSSSSLDPSSARELEQSEHAVAVAVAAAAAADAAVVAAAEAAAAVVRLTGVEEEGHLSVSSCNGEDAAAARIQATFRGYLAWKALCALRGLVKLQALVRGQLVRRQATATLRRMQALVDAQSRLRAQRARMLDADHGATPPAYQYQARRSPQHQHIPRRRSSYEVMERSLGEEHVKIVEMDVGEPPARQRGRSSCSAAATESRDRRLAEYYHGGGQCSPAPSSFFGGDLSISSPPRAYSGHFEDVFAFDPAAAAATARSSPYIAPYDAGGGGDGYAYDGGAVPSYMANTESSRAKARSQSAPRQRTDPAAALERQPSGRRRGGAPSRKMMQRSSSHIGVPAAAAACGYGGGYGYGYGGYQQQQHAQPPWAGVRLDRSSASVAGSECGSTSSVLTAATVGYCRSLVGFEVQRGHY